MQLEKAVTTNPNQGEFETLQRICKAAVTSNFLGSAYRVGLREEQLAKAVVVAMKGRELGVPAMQAFSHIHVIQGKPTISAELMLALIYKNYPNAEIIFLELGNELCKIKARRPGTQDFTGIEFTLEDAKRAGLVKKGSGWEKYPRAMLRSRAVSEMARTLFPDAIMGCSYTPEELGAEVASDSGESDFIETTVAKESSEIKDLMLEIDSLKDQILDEDLLGKVNGFINKCETAADLTLAKNRLKELVNGLPKRNYVDAIKSQGVESRP